MPWEQRRDPYVWSAVIVAIFLAMPLATLSADEISGYTAGVKLARGVSNLVLGFVEIPRNIYSTGQWEERVI